VEYAHENLFTANGSYDIVKKAFSVGVLAGYEGALFGGSVDLKSDFGVKKFSVGGGYRADEYSVVATTDCADSVTVSYIHDFTKEVSGAAVFKRWLKEQVKPKDADSDWKAEDVRK
jgi:hypothetical protein